MFVNGLGLRSGEDACWLLGSGIVYKKEISTVRLAGEWGGVGDGALASSTRKSYPYLHLTNLQKAVQF